jgi:hypothetical protein
MPPAVEAKEKKEEDDRRPRVARANLVPRSRVASSPQTQQQLAARRQ